MVGVITGPGLLGSESFQHGIGSEKSSNGQTLGGDSYVNLSNGRLILQYVDESLSGSSGDLNYIRYTGGDAITDADGDGWSDGVRRVDSSLNLSTNPSLGSSFTWYMRDGSAVEAVWNGSIYVIEDGAGAHDTVEYDSANNRLIWTNGDSGFKEYVDFSSGSPTRGRILSSRDTEGNGRNYDYDQIGTGAYRLMQITAVDSLSSSGQILKLDYDSKGRLEYLKSKRSSSSAEVTETQYIYNSSEDSSSTDNRLKEVIHHWVDDEGAAQTYSTEYLYFGSTNLVRRVIQADGTRLDIEYQSYTNDQNETDYRVLSVEDRWGYTTFTYNDNEVVITKGDYSTITHTFENNGKRHTITHNSEDGPDQTKIFNYDDSGNLVEVEDGKQNLVKRDYDDNGNLTHEWVQVYSNRYSLTIWRYSSDNLLQSKTLYRDALPHVDTSNYEPPADEEGNTFYYVYDNERNLRYTVSAEGRVSRTDYVNNSYGKGKVQRQINYAEAHYHNVANLARDAILTESDLSNWESTLNGAEKSAIELTEYTYNNLDQLEITRQYANVGTNLAGIKNDGFIETHFAYDPYGKLLESYTQQRYSISTNPVIQESYTYDGIGRIKTSFKAGVSSSYEYDMTAVGANAEGAVQRIDLGSNKVSYEAFDARGRMVYSQVYDNANSSQVRQVNYEYDDAGRLFKTYSQIGSDLTVSYTYYNDTGQVSFEVSASGGVTAYKYDENGQLSEKIVYDTGLTQSELSSLTKSSNLTMAMASRENPAKDLNIYYSYHADGTLASTSEDFPGGIFSFTHTSYESNQEFNGVNYILTTDPFTNEPAQYVVNFYDKDGLLIGQTDPEGALTEYVYDGVGRLIQKIRYEGDASVPIGVRFDSVRSRVNVDNDQDGYSKLTTHFYYDAQGRQIGKVDEQGFFTETEYQASRFRKLQHRYNAPLNHFLNIDPETPSFNDIKNEIAGRKRYTTTETYDRYGRLYSTTESSGLTTQYLYDEAGRLSKAVEHVANTTSPNLSTLELPFGQDGLWDFTENGWRSQTGSTPSGNTGPSGDAGDDGVYAFLESSVNGVHRPGEDAVLESQSFYASGNSELQFKYHMFGSRIGTLAVEVFYDGQWQEMWSLSGQQHTSTTSAWSSASVNLAPYQGSIKVRFKGTAIGNSASGSDGYKGDMAIDSVSITNASRLGQRVTHTHYNAFGEVIGTVSGEGARSLYEGNVLIESFEGFTSSTPASGNGWTTESKLANGTDSEYSFWQARHYNTPSYDTGPSGGGSVGGNFAYFETSGGYAYNEGDVGTLTSPEFTINHDGGRLEFDYHMYGANVGRLSIDVNIGGEWQELWMIEGQQHSSHVADWTRKSIDLSAYRGEPLKVRFRAEAVQNADNWLGDIAIDNIRILDGQPQWAVNQNPSDTEIQRNVDAFGVRYEFDQLGRQLVRYDAEGQKTWFFYDQANRLTHTVNGEREVTETEYDAHGRVLKTRKYANIVEQSVLDQALSNRNASNSQLFSGSNALQKHESSDEITTFEYDARGLLLSSTDAVGNQVVNEYNGFGEVVSTTHQKIIDEDNTRVDRIKTFKRDALGRAVESYIQKQDGSEVLTGTQTFDAFGRLTRSTDGLEQETTFRYLWNGRLVEAYNSHGEVSTFSHQLNLNYEISIESSEDVSAFLFGPETHRYTSADGSTRIERPDGSVIVTKLNEDGQVLAVTDGRGNTTRHEYDLDGNLRSVVDALGNRIEHNSRDESGRVIQIMDANGSITEVTYDHANRKVIERIDPDDLNIEKHYVYDNIGRLTGESLNTLETAKIYTYNQNGSLRSTTTDPTGLTLTTTYEYDSLGNTTKVARGDWADPYQSVTEYEYDEWGRKSKEIIDPEGLELTTEYFYDNAGNLTRVIDANGNSSWNVYDSENRLSKTISATGSVVEHYYDLNGKSWKTVQRYNALTQTQLNALADEDISDGIGEGYDVQEHTSDAITVFLRDGLGRVQYELKKALDIGSGALSLWKPSEIVYDENGNITQRHNYNVYLHSDNNNPIFSSIESARQHVESSANLNKLNVTNNQAIHYFYDANNRVTHTAELVGPSSDGVTGLYKLSQKTYNAVGELEFNTAISELYDGDPNNLANIQSFISGESNSRSSESIEGDQTTQYFYDKAGRNIFTIDALGFVEQNIYDALGQLTSRARYSQQVGADRTLEGLINTYDAPAYYDNEARVWFFEYDNAGRLEREIQPATMWLLSDGADSLLAIAKEYKYDDLGNVTEVIEGTTSIAVAGFMNLEAGSHRTRYAYDSASRKTFEVDADGNLTNYRYDALGKVTKVVEYAEQIPLANGILSEQDILEAIATQYGVPAQDDNDGVIRPSSNIVTDFFESFLRPEYFGQFVSSFVPDGVAQGASDELQSSVGKAMLAIRNTFLRDNVFDGGYFSVPEGVSVEGGLISEGFLEEAFESLYTYEYAVNQIVDGVDVELFIEIGLSALGGATPEDGLSLNFKNYSTSFYLNASKENVQVEIGDSQAEPVKMSTSIGVVSLNAPYDSENEDIFWSEGVSRLILPVASDQLLNSEINKSYILGLANNANNRTQEFVYDNDGRQRYSITSAKTISETTYDALGRVESNVTYDLDIGSVGATAVGQRDITDIQQYIQASGQVFGQADSNGKKVVRGESYTYDNLGRLTQATDAEGYSDSYIHDTYGNVTRHTNKRGYDTSYKYDALSRRVTEISPKVSVAIDDELTQQERHIIIKTEYDAFGNVKARHQGIHGADRFDPTTWDHSRVLTTRYQYDALNRQTNVLHGGLYSESEGRFYSDGEIPQNQIANYFKRETVLEYNAYGNVIKTTEKTAPNEEVSRRNAYDALDRVIFEQDERGYLSAYEYNRYGEQVKQTMYAEQQDFDGIEEELSTYMRSRAELETTGSIITSDFDRTIETEYDNLGRKSRVLLDEVDFHSNLAKGEKPESISNLATRDRPETVFQYNAFGEVIAQHIKVESSESFQSNPESWSSNYYYFDNLGNKTRVVDPLNYLTETLYDAFGNITNVTEYENALTGQEKSLLDEGNFTFARLSEKDRITHYSYDAKNQLTETFKSNVEFYAWSDSSQNFIESSAYDREDKYLLKSSEYDELGNIIHTSELGKVTEMEYDELSRLESTIKPERSVVAKNVGTGSVVNPFGENGQMLVAPETHYTYDVSGNLVQVVESSHGTRAVSKVSKYSYDAISNVIESLETVDKEEGAVNHVDKIVNREFTSMGLVRQEVSSISGEYEKGWTNSSSQNPVVTRDGNDTIALFSYDVSGNLTSSTQLYTDSTGAQKRSGITTDYNGFGEVTARWLVAGPEESPVKYKQESAVFDNAGRLRFRRGVDGGVEQWYDLSGQLTLEAQLGSDGTEDDRITEWVKDLGGRTLEVRLPSFSDYLDSAFGVNPEKSGSSVFSIFSNEETGQTTAFNVLADNGQSYTLYYNADIHSSVSVTGPVPSNLSLEDVRDSIKVISRQLFNPVKKREYDRWGNTVLDVNEADHQVEHGYDFANRLVSTSQDKMAVDINSSTNSQVVQTQQTLNQNYWYDEFGNLVGQSAMAQGDDQSHRAHINFYNAVGQLTQNIDATGRSKYFAYDIYGNAVAEMNGEGIVKTHDFNRSDQIARTSIIRNRLDDGTVVAYNHNSGAPGTRVESVLNDFIFDESGRQISEWGYADYYDRTGEVSHDEYDERGLVIKTTSRAGIVVDYEYDEFGNRTKKEEVNGLTMEWFYGEGDFVANRLETILFGMQENDEYVSGNFNERFFEYTDFGQVQSEVVVQDLGSNNEYLNPATDRKNYDYLENGLLGYIWNVGTPNATDAPLFIGVDVTGYSKTQSLRYNILGLETFSYFQDTRTQSQDSSTRQYDYSTTSTYDKLGQLVSVSGYASNSNVVAGGSEFDESSLDYLNYSYDLFGNRVHVGGQYTQGGSDAEEDYGWYKYDKEGRVKVEKGRLSQGDVYLISQKSKSFNYDDAGRVFQIYEFDSELENFKEEDDEVVNIDKFIDKPIGQGPTNSILIYIYGENGYRQQYYYYPSNFGGRTISHAEFNNSSETEVKVYYDTPTIETKYKRTTFAYNDLDLQLSRNVGKGRSPNSSEWYATGDISSVWYKGYNDFGFETEMRFYEKQSGSTNRVYVDRQYDADGRILLDTVRRRTYGQPSGTYHASVVTDYDYEEAGNLYYTTKTFAKNDGGYLYTETYNVKNDFTGGGYHKVSERFRVSGDVPDHISASDSQLNYDAHGVLLEANVGGPSGGQSSFLYNFNGQIIHKYQKHTNSSQEDASEHRDPENTTYFYRDGNTIATVSEAGSNIFPIEPHTEQLATPGFYTISRGDSLASIAVRLFGDASLWYIIAEYNGLDKGPLDVFNSEEVGTELRIPNTVKNLKNTSENYSPYDPSSIVGPTSRTPAVYTIPPPPEPKCEMAAQFIGAVVQIAVTIIVFAYTGDYASSSAAGAYAGSTASQVAYAIGNDEYDYAKAFRALGRTSVFGVGPTAVYYMSKGDSAQDSFRDAFNPLSTGVENFDHDAAERGAAVSYIGGSMGSGWASGAASYGANYAIARAQGEDPSFSLRGMAISAFSSSLQGAYSGGNYWQIALDSALDTGIDYYLKKNHGSDEQRENAKWDNSMLALNTAGAMLKSRYMQQEESQQKDVPWWKRNGIRAAYDYLSSRFSSSSNLATPLQSSVHPSSGQGLPMSGMADGDTSYLYAGERFLAPGAAQHSAVDPLTGLGYQMSGLADGDTSYLYHQQPRYSGFGEFVDRTLGDLAERQYAYDAYFKQQERTEAFVNAIQGRRDNTIGDVELLDLSRRTGRSRGPDHPRGYKYSHIQSALGVKEGMALDLNGMNTANALGALVQHAGVFLSDESINGFMEKFEGGQRYVLMDDLINEGTIGAAAYIRSLNSYGIAQELHQNAMQNPYAGFYAAGGSAGFGNLIVSSGEALRFTENWLNANSDLVPQSVRSGAQLDVAIDALSVGIEIAPAFGVLFKGAARVAGLGRIVPDNLDLPLHRGSGPAPGVLEISPRTTSTSAIENYSPLFRQQTRGGVIEQRNVEFIFDTEKNVFLVGKQKDYAGEALLSPHQRLAELSRSDSSNLVGGMFSRGPNGSIRTNEYSGHFHDNWNEASRQQFTRFLNENGLKVEHEIWTGL